MFLETLARLISNKIKIIDKNLKIAKDIDLEEPILKLMIDNDKISAPIDSLKYLSILCYGSIALSHQKLYLEQLLSQLENLDLTNNYNPIVKQDLAYFPRSTFEYTIVALIIGFFFLS